MLFSATLYSFLILPGTLQVSCLSSPAPASAKSPDPIVINDELSSSSQQVTKRSHSALSDFVQSHTAQEKPSSEVEMMKEDDDDKKIQMVQKRYDEFFEYIFSVYPRYAASVPVPVLRSYSRR